MLKSNFNVKVSIEGYVDENGKQTKMDLTTRISGDCDTNIFEEIKDTVSFFKKLADDDVEKQHRQPRHYVKVKQEDQSTETETSTGLDLIQSLTPDQVRKLKKLLKRL